MYINLLAYLFALLVILFVPRLGNCQEKFDEQPLKEIIGLLCPEHSKDLLGEVLLAVNEPKKYLETFNDALSERGIEAWREVDFWLALIDGLERRKCLIESDWKNCGTDFAWQLNQLKASQANGLDWTALEKLGMSYKKTFEFASEVEKVLKPKNLALVFLSYEGDSYAFSLVSTASVEKLREASKKLSRRIEVFDKDTRDT